MIFCGAPRACLWVKSNRHVNIVNLRHIFQCVFRPIFCEICRAFNFEISRCGVARRFVAGPLMRIYAGARVYMFAVFVFVFIVIRVSKYVFCYLLNHFLSPLYRFSSPITSHDGNDKVDGLAVLSLGLKLTWEMRSQAQMAVLGSLTSILIVKSKSGWLQSTRRAKQIR